MLLVWGARVGWGLVVLAVLLVAIAAGLEAALLVAVPFAAEFDVVASPAPLTSRRIGEL